VWPENLSNKERARASQSDSSTALRMTPSAQED
jgi:hypothetical protein